MYVLKLAQFIPNAHTTKPYLILISGSPSSIGCPFRNPEYYLLHYIYPGLDLGSGLKNITCI